MNLPSLFAIINAERNCVQVYRYNYLFHDKYLLHIDLITYTEAPVCGDLGHM